MIAYLSWNPDSTFFTLPYIDHPIKWYGVCFMLGFVLAYLLIIPPLRRYSKEPQKLADRLLWTTLIGTILGARLGHILFYEPSSYFSNPTSIFKIWEGGLASHGGAIGVPLSIYCFYLYSKKEFPKLTFLNITDIVAVPTALVGFFIRMGNFFNQEIIGTQTTMPWAVIFGDPFDRSAIVPRHPSQLYEALAYLAIFAVLWLLQQKPQKAGKLTGLFFILVFTSRFLIEFTKELQPSVLNQSYLQAGQWLSLPFIFLGLILFYCARSKNSPSLS